MVKFEHWKKNDEITKSTIDMTCEGGVPCSGNHRYQQWQEKEAA